MKWYNKTSKYYDLVCEKFYHKDRIELIEKLDLVKGDKVLLVACGTGLSFEMILQKIGSQGMIIGIDTSKGMLDIAKKKVLKNKWSNVHLILENAEEMNIELIKTEIGQEIQFDKVIGELAFSVIPDWKKAMKRSIALLKNNGKIGVLDAFRKKNNWLTRILNFLPNSEMSRDISGYLSQLTDNYWSKKLGKTKILFIGIGQKKKL